MGAIVLVRHAQARWDSDDYDQLSSLGEQQAMALGRWFKDRPAPAVVVSGDMRRHRHTAELAVDEAGWGTDIRIEPGWNEFDHRQMLEVHDAPLDLENVDPEVAFRDWFNAATARWTSGEYDADYDEPFSGFTSRVDVALRHLVNQVGSGEEAVVFTSGGPICWAATALLGGETHVWLRLVPVIANASLTRIVVGRRGVSLSTFNEHGHFDPPMITYW